MKRIWILTLFLLLLLPSCMDRPDQLDNTEPETEAETEYIPPPKSYLEQLALDPGYADFPDSVWCYQAALIDEDDFVSADEINFDLDNPAEERFISFNYTRIVEFQLDKDAPAYAETTGYTTEYPNVSYLTTADGKREKLCPHTDCREDAYEPCTHVDLSNGKVLGDWVYFIGQNFCIAAPSNPNRGENGYVNMLLRYSLTEHRIEKYLDLPDSVYNPFTAYGVLYLEVRDPISGTNYFILVDEDGNAAKAPHALYCRTPLDGYLYGSYGTTIYRSHHNLTEREEFTLKTPGVPSIKGTAKGKLYLRMLDVGSGSKTHYEDCSDQNITIITLDEKLRETVILSGVYDFAVTENHLYAAMRETSYAFSQTDRHGDERHYYSNSTGKVIRYDLASDGSIAGESVVVFDSAVDTAEEGEYIRGIEKYGGSIRIETFFYPPSEDSNLLGTRFYLITPDGVREDGEGLLH